jgi:tRNA C32,U32 (ribose-2'-O)-methylase TrmJ
MTRLRRLFTRVGMDDKEVQMLRGVLKELDPGTGPIRAQTDRERAE